METIPKTTTLNVRIDSTLKKESDELFKDMGLSMSSAISMFLTKCVRTASIPFRVERDNPNFAKEASKELEAYDNGSLVLKKYDNMSDLITDMNKD